MEQTKPVKEKKKKVRTFKVHYTSIHDDYLTFTTEWSKKELREVVIGGGIVDATCYHSIPNKIRVRKIEVIPEV
jgi:hypothetical protein